MTIKIGSNIASLQAQRRLGEATTSLSQIYERLSSGQRINKAADDAGGLAISSSLNFDAKVFTQAIRNVNDGISALNIAEGGIEQLSNITIRQKELAEQAANGTFSATQRAALNREASELTNEYNRIIDTTKFNGISLFQNSPTNLSIQTGYGSSAVLDFSIGSSLSGAISADTNTLNLASGAEQQSYIYFTNGLSAEYFDVQILADFDDAGNLSVDNYSTSLPNVIYLDGESIGFNNGTYGGYGSVNIDLSGQGYMTASQISEAITSQFSSPLYTVSQVSSDTIRFTSTDASNRADISFDNMAATTLVSNGNSWGGSVIGDGGYITFHTSNGAGLTSNYYVYFTSSSGSNDPSLSGYTGIEALKLTELDSLDMATLAASAINTALGGAHAIASSSNVNGYDALIISNLSKGSVPNMTSFGPSSASTSGVITAGVDPAINITTDTFTAASHGLSTGDMITFQSSGGLPGGLTLSTNYYAIKVDSDHFQLATSSANALAATEINITSTGSGTQTFSFVSSGTSGVIRATAIDLTSVSSARTSLTTLETRLQNINLELGRQGAFQSRLEVAQNTLKASRENYLAAAGRITDADMASESANLVRTQILQSSATAVLAQANQQPSLAVSLLRQI